MTFTADECLHALQTAADEYGPKVTMAEYRAGGFSPSVDTIKARLGGWNAGKTAAGLTPTARGETARFRAPNYSMEPSGHMAWRHKHDGESLYVSDHRLLAAAVFGFEAIRGKHIHHIDGVPWHNTPENLLPMDPAEHSAHHAPGRSGGGAGAVMAR